MLLFFLVAILLFQALVTEAQESITFSWDWSPGNSGYTSGPNGNIAYALYTHTEDDTGFTFDHPLVSGLDDCWWNIDKYSCQTRLDYTFDPGVTYYFVVVAYLVENDAKRSGVSNEVEIMVNITGGGGGCFIGVGA